MSGFTETPSEPDLCVSTYPALRIFLRACLKRSGSSQPTNHQASHGDVNHRFATFRKDFIVLAKPSTLGEPGKGALNHPTPWQDDKAFLILRAQHRLQDELAVQEHPLQEETTI